MKVDNAVILAAGTASRFAPLSYEKPKALAEVKGEVLIERQIRQLHEAGINKVYVVTGYKSELFLYLEKKCNVKLIHNPYYKTRNNNSSIKAVEDILKNTYICCADNYFNDNPFNSEEECAFYSALYSDGRTNEWCITTDEDGFISKVTIGGISSWYMLGHVFWDEEFSNKFTKILDKVYDLPETADKYWEDIFIENIDKLKMKMKKYPSDIIFEFDTIDELREFDDSYVKNTRSSILKSIAARLNVSECDMDGFKSFNDKNNEASGFTFNLKGNIYSYKYADKKIVKITEKE